MLRKLDLLPIFVYGHSSSAIEQMTDLQMTQRPKWTRVSFGRDYCSNFCVFGERILLSRPAGYATLEDAKESLRLNEQVVKEGVLKDADYVIIEDFSNLRGNEPAARAHFINHLKNNKRLLGLIFCGTSPFFTASIKLCKRFNIVKIDVQVVRYCSEALELAVDVLSASFSYFVIQNLFGTYQLPVIISIFQYPLWHDCCGYLGRR